MKQNLRRFGVGDLLLVTSGAASLVAASIAAPFGSQEIRIESIEFSPNGEDLAVVRSDRRCTATRILWEAKTLCVCSVANAPHNKVLHQFVSRRVPVSRIQIIPSTTSIAYIRNEFILLSNESSREVLQIPISTDKDTQISELQAMRFVSFTTAKDKLLVEHSGIVSSIGPMSLKPIWEADLGLRNTASLLAQDNRNHIVVGTHDGVYILSSNDGKLECWIPYGTDYFNIEAGLIGLGSHVFVGHHDSLAVFDTNTREEISRVSVFSDLIRIDTTGQYIARTDSYKDGIFILNCHLHDLAHIVPPVRVSSLKFSPDGLLLATGCEDGTVRLYSTSNWQEVTRYVVPGYRANTVCAPVLLLLSVLCFLIASRARSSKEKGQGTEF